VPRLRATCQNTQYRRCGKPQLVLPIHHEDVMVASARAYVHALNKLEWPKKRRDVDAPRGI
jgi:hypothetical protein